MITVRKKYMKNSEYAKLKDVSLNQNVHLSVVN